ncbi:hypothetical protein BH11ACT8_BH11ACT8_28490 [soil metagenome]
MRFSRTNGYEPTDPVYFDADGDGDEDMAAPLSYADGNGVGTHWYFWLWDADTETPEQVPYPIAESSRCGAVIRSVTLKDGALRVVQVLRDEYLFGQSCADAPTIVVTRRVAVEAGYPVAVGGVGGWGGLCPTFQATDVGYAASGPGAPSVYPAPSRDVKPLTGLDGVTLVEILSTVPEWLTRKGWRLYWLYDEKTDAPPYDEDGRYQPCAWLPE